MRRDENAKQLTTKMIVDAGAGENLFTNNDSLTLSDTS